MVPAQIASSCWTTSGCASSLFACALMAISRVEIRATRVCDLAFCEFSQFGAGVEFPLLAVADPWSG